MNDEEKKEFSGGVELSLDISNETMQNLKEALGINELEQINKRFENGTETLEDIMYHCLNYGIDLKNGKQLRLVETKYFDKLVEYIEKQQKEIEKKDICLKECEKNLIEERTKRIKQDKIINEMAKYITEIDIDEYFCPKCKYRNKECTLEECIEITIDYFTKKVGE